MPKIVLANPHSRAMVARPDDVPVESRPIYDVIAGRMLWGLEDSDIVVITSPVDKDFVSYVCGVLDVAADTVTVLSLADYNGALWYPGDQAELVEEIRQRMRAGGRTPQDWTLSCYIHDRDIAHWERELGLDAASAPYAQDLAALVNSKSVFRTLALAAGTPIAEGRVVDPGRELLESVCDLVGRTGSVIVKQDQNAGGDGNVLVTVDPGVVGYGVFHVVTIDPQDSGPAAVAERLTACGLSFHRPLYPPPGTAAARYAVEVYHPGARTLSSELYVPAHGAPVLLNYGDMRMEPVWNGYGFPPQGLPATALAELCAHSQQIATSAQHLGYQGLMNIDAIVDVDGRVLFTEFNGRAGGATNIDTIGRRLVGEDYLRRCVVLTRNGLASPRTEQLVPELRDAGLLFDPDRRSGIVVATDDVASGTIEYVAIGRDRQEAESIERELELLLAEQAAPC